MAELKVFFSGPRPVGDSAVPPLVFVATNAAFGIRPAAVAAIGVAAALMALRIWQGRPAVYAMGGVIGVAFAAYLALRSDQAEEYFLPGIISNAFWTAVAVVSMVIRRPMMAFTSWAFHRWPLQWYWLPNVRPAYTEVTAAWALFFAGRGYVQFRLFEGGDVAALGIVKVGTGLPAVLLLVIGTYLYGTWRLERLGAPTVDEYSDGLVQGGVHRGF